MVQKRWFKFFLVGLALTASAWLAYVLYLSPRQAKQADALFPSSKTEEHSHHADHSHHSLAHELSEIPLPKNVQNNLPPAGSYELHKIFKSPKHNILDSDGNTVELDNYTTGKYTLLTFFYETCADAKGCPFAISTLHALRGLLKQKPELAQHVRFVNISFDPIRDTPPMMKSLEKSMNQGEKSNAVEWRFMTTKSVDNLMPIIDSFGQNVEIVMDTETGEETMQYQHVLKMFLIDKEGYVREIYSALDLSPEILLNDIYTLAIADS